MNIISTLQFLIGKDIRSVQAGIPTSESELEDIFRFRYDRYSQLGYIDPEKFPENRDVDEYDSGRTVHIVVSDDKQIIGYVRVITGDVLPTEVSFEFTKPPELARIDSFLAELGRLIVIKPEGYAIPRHIVMLYIFKTILDTQSEILGGYSFVKSSLQTKLNRLKLPIHEIMKSKCIYPENGTLGPYFGQLDNPVVPIYFIRTEIENYIQNVFREPLIKIEGVDIYRLNNSMYSKLLTYLRAL